MKQERDFFLLQNTELWLDDISENWPVRNERSLYDLMVEKGLYSTTTYWKDAHVLERCLKLKQEITKHA